MINTPPAKPDSKQAIKQAVQPITYILGLISNGMRLKVYHDTTQPPELVYTAHNGTTFLLSSDHTKDTILCVPLIDCNELINSNRLFKMLPNRSAEGCRYGYIEMGLPDGPWDYYSLIS